MNTRNTSLLAAFAVIFAGTIYAGVHTKDPYKLLPSKQRDATAPKCHATGDFSKGLILPDPKCTPGALNASVTQATINKTICVSGYTKTIRPPVSYTNSLKQQSMVDYGFNDSITAHEEDHFIPLELGGSADSVSNLWAEPGATPNPKDHVENYLHRQVCNGKMTLADAQKEISTNWVQVYYSVSNINTY